MTAHAYTEDQLVEQPAIGLFAELGWTTGSALEETSGAPSPGLAATLSHPMGEGASLGRETKGEVVSVSRLSRFISSGLERLNPALPPEAITAAVDELTRDRSAMSLEAANRGGLHAHQRRDSRQYSHGGEGRRGSGDCAHGRGTPQPIRHPGVEHAR